MNNSVMTGSNPQRLVRGAIAWNLRASRAVDSLLRDDYSLDGKQEYQETFAPMALGPGLRIVDVGGGRHPFLSAERKRALNVHVMGLDISADELAHAPTGCYDVTVCADITHYTGDGMADVVFCQAVLQHVRDVEAALTSIVSLLKPGGVAVLFVPSRNAVYARLNLLLSDALRRGLLCALYPQQHAIAGVVRYHYDRCTPGDFMRLAASAGAPMVDCRCYYMSAYLTCCVPLHCLWRLWMVCFRALKGRQAAETFACTLQKPPVYPSDCPR
ncbi:MAG TPA: methyltransferase domain-containing protein [Nitrospiraceae bacterium]|nr:methyltransferase domain-containing protein [Nitrospiraceae bacterium]